MERPMKSEDQPYKRVIWILNSNRWGSAISEYTLQMAQALSHKFDVIYSPLRSSPADKKAIKMGLNVFPVDKFNSSALDFLKGLKGRISPNFIITTGGPETFLVSKLKKSKFEVRIRFRGDHLKLGLFRKAGFKLAHRNFDAFLTPSKLIENQIKQISSRKVKTVLLGVDSDRFRVKKDVNRVDTHPKIMIFGRLDPVKGHEKFIEIFSVYKQTFPQDQTRLLIFGREENTSEKMLLSATRRYGVSDWVDFEIGTIENVPDVLSLVDVGVISSLGSEVICRVAHEFLLCGTKVLLSGAGATNEVLVDPDFGSSYKNCTVEETVQLIKKMIDDRPSSEEKTKLSAEAKKHFSLESMALELEMFLEDLSIFGA
jgi:glycosyltransferase involved in cell wall biosynthesis